MSNQSRLENVNNSSSSLNETGTGGYESLWEVSERGLNPPFIGAADEASEVNADDDILEDQQDLYENLCVNLNNFTMNVGKYLLVVECANDLF